MSSKDASKILREYLLDPKTIKAVVRELLKSLNRKKRSESRAAGFVVGLSDRSNEKSDLQLNLIKREIERQDPAKKCLISTMNTNNPEELDSFENSDFDVLLVKNMGGRGFDCSRIKSVLYVSTTKSLPSFIQAINRGCRKFGCFRNFDVILPKAQRYQKLWKDFEDFTSFQVEDSELLSSEEEIVDFVDSPCVDDLNVFDDHVFNHNLNDRDRRDEIIDLFNRKKPEIANLLTNDEKLKEYETHASVFGSDWLERLPDPGEIEVTLIDPNEEENRLRKRMGVLKREVCSDICRRIRNYAPFKESHKTDGIIGKVSSLLWWASKISCGFHGNLTLENLVGVENYRKLTAYYEKLKENLDNKPKQSWSLEEARTYLKNFR